MGLFNIKDKSELRLHAERVGIGILQVNDELRKWPSSQPMVRGLCRAISNEMLQMYVIADKLSSYDKLTMSLSFNGQMILYNEFIREVEKFRAMLLNHYQIQLF